MHLRGELVPQLSGELAICDAEGINESVFEGLDSLFHGVYPVVVGFNQLKRDFLWGKESFYGFCSLVIHHVTFVLSPLLTRYSKFDLYASKMCSESRPAMGVIGIAFVLLWYMTKEHMLPLSNMYGKLPLQSLYTNPKSLSANAPKQNTLAME